MDISMGVGAPTSTVLVIVEIRLSISLIVNVTSCHPDVLNVYLITGPVVFIFVPSLKSQQYHQINDPSECAFYAKKVFGIVNISIVLIHVSFIVDKPFVSTILAAPFLPDKS
jgi:hypothetical protein